MRPAELKQKLLFFIFVASFSATISLGLLLGSLAPRHYLFAFLFALSASAICTQLLGSRWAVAMRRLQETTERVDVELPLDWPPISHVSELHELSEAIRRKLESLQGQFAELRRQGSEQKAVLSSMSEGVLAFDTEERVLTINEAAAELMGVELQSSKGRSLPEVVRNYDLLRFTGEVLKADSPLEVEVVLRGRDARVIQAHGSPLRDEDNQRIGALVVLHDITKLRKLESLRREFVANVSHELRTPITSIQGFVEALSDGALEDPQLARKFLSIVSRQVQGLNAIIDDLLQLSTIEQQTEGYEIELREGKIIDVLESAREVCLLKAEARKIEVRLTCEASLSANFNATLLEQAIVNLLDNAIKYSEEGQTVSLTASAEDGDLLIAVQDRGWGISNEDLQRVFERFYRVDKGRTRKSGGTGLGLAITKHVALAHRGTVQAESTLGQGSRFTLRLPSTNPSSIST